MRVTKDMLRRRAAGESYKQIGDRLGVAASTVMRALKKWEAEQRLKDARKAEAAEAKRTAQAEQTQARMRKLAAEDAPSSAQDRMRIKGGMLRRLNGLPDPSDEYGIWLRRRKTVPAHLLGAEDDDPRLVAYLEGRKS